MLPKWHIVLGAIFSILIYFLFNISLFQASLIFLASVFIDVDHYIWFVLNKKDWNLKSAYEWHKKIPLNHKPFIQIFHTVELLIILLILSYFWFGFLFILLGIVFHSILDLIEMSYTRTIHLREYSLIAAYLKKSHKKSKLSSIF
jgi:hypothetical protein